MEWFVDILVGNGFAHTMATLAFVIAVGMWLGRFKICGVSLGATFVLLVGIAVSHFGMKWQDNLYEEFKVEIPVAAQAEAPADAVAQNAENAQDAETAEAEAASQPATKASVRV